MTSTSKPFELPVLWVEGEGLAETDWKNNPYSVVATTRPYVNNKEPYIPVARVREMIAEMRHLYGRNCLIAESLDKLIADVEEDGK